MAGFKFISATICAFVFLASQAFAEQVKSSDRAAKLAAYVLLSGADQTSTDSPDTDNNITPETPLMDIALERKPGDYEAAIAKPKNQSLAHIDLHKTFLKIRKLPLDEFGENTDLSALNTAANSEDWQRAHTANIFLASLYLRRQQVARGVQFAQAALATIPSDITNPTIEIARYNAYYVLHTAFIMDNNIEKALSSTERLVEYAIKSKQDLDEFNVVHNLSVLYYYAGEYETALKITKLLIDELPSRPKYEQSIANFGHGKNLNNLGAYRDAIPFLKQSISQSKHAGLTRSAKQQLALAYASTGQIVKAQTLQDEISETIKEGTYNGNALSNMSLKIQALILKHKGDYEGAFNNYQIWSDNELQRLKSGLSADRKRANDTLILTEQLADERLGALTRENNLIAQLLEKRSQTQRYLFLAAGLLLTLIIVLMYNRRRLKSINQDLTEARDDALIGEKTKSQILAVLSHEVRTPLNAIIPISEQLLTQSNDPTQRKLLRLIKVSGQQLLSMMNNVIVISKGTDYFVNSPSKVKLDDFMRDVLEPYLLVIKGKNLTLKATYPKSVPKNLSFDTDKTEMILSNLISNAVKFSKSGTITFATAYSDHGDVKELTFTIKDQAHGIDLSKVETYLKPFSQEDMSISRNFDGLGIGLSAAKTYADSIGGQLKFTNNSPSGTTVTLTLPLQEISGQKKGRIAA